MRRSLVPSSLAIAMIALLAGRVPLSAQGAKADLALVHGKIITVDAGDRITQAVAIAGDRIMAVGTDDEIARLIGPRTKRIDLHGLTVTPGLLDAHAHFSSGGADRDRKSVV